MVGIMGGLAAGAAGGAGINIIIRAVDNFSKTFAMAQTQVRGLGGVINRHRAGIMMAGAAITGAMVGIAATSIKSFATFEEQMISSMVMFDDVTDAQKEAARDLSITLSKELGMAAEEVTKALWYFGSAGMDVNTTLETMPDVLKFAKVNILGVAEASDFAMTAMKVFGVEAKDMNKLLDEATFVMKNAKMSMSDLAEAMSYVGPVAANLNIEFSDLSILVGVLADAGISGSRAGTVLRMAIMKLTAPTGQAKDIIEELGIEIFDAEGKFKGIWPVLAQFEEKMGTMSDKEREFAMKTIFGVRQVAGMNAILKKGTKEMVKYSKEVKETTGSVDTMMDEIEEGVEFQMDQFNASVQELKISLGEALVPVLLDIIDILKPMVEWFKELEPSTKRNIIIFGGLLGVALLLAPAMVALGGALVTIGTSAATAMGLASPFFAALAGLAGIGLIAISLGFAFSAMSEEDTKKALMKIFASSVAIGLAALIFGAGGPISIVIGIVTALVLLEMRFEFIEKIQDWIEKQSDIIRERWEAYMAGQLDFGELFVGKEELPTDVIWDLELGVAATRAEIERLRATSIRDFGEVRRVVMETGEAIGSPVKGSYPIVYSLLQAQIQWKNMSITAITAIQAIISELNKIPREIVTTHIIRTVRKGGGILGFQEGGVMPYTGLAYLHKGETVIPSTGGGRGGTIVNIENVYGLDPDEVAEALQDKLDTLIST